MNLDEFIEITWENFDKYGLTKQGWTFSTNENMHRTHGICYPTDRLIIFSEKAIEQLSKSDLLNLLWHECAHALVDEVADHGPKWMAKAVELGAKPLAYSTCRVRRTSMILI